jgi:DNA-binding transcriptional MerR regulator
VSRLTGLSPDVIRVWERRYKLVAPRRGPRGARLYGATDVERLRLLRGAVQDGRRIRDVAHLPLRALAELGAGHARPRAQPPTAPAAQVLEAVRRYDADALDTALGDALVACGARRFVCDVAAPLLESVGAGWQAGRLAIADERLVSEALRGLLAGLVRIRLRAGAPRVILGTPTGERHEFGLLLAGILAVEAGLRPYHLGVHVPAAELADAARRADAAVVAVSVVYRGNRARAVAEIGRLRRALPPGVELWVGGRDGAAVGRAVGRPRVTVVDDLERTAGELERVARGR